MVFCEMWLWWKFFFMYLDNNCRNEMFESVLKLIEQKRYVKNVHGCWTNISLNLTFLLMMAFFSLHSSVVFMNGRWLILLCLLVMLIAVCILHNKWLQQKLLFKCWENTVMILHDKFSKRRGRNKCFFYSSWRYVSKWLSYALKFCK